MTPYGLVGRHDARSRHRWLNRFQTALLVLTLVGIAAAAGSLLFGEIGLWLALATCALTLLIEPVAASAMTLRLYGARPLRPDEAPAIWSLLLINTSFVAMNYGHEMSTKAWSVQNQDLLRIQGAWAIDWSRAPAAQIFQRKLESEAGRGESKRPFFNRSSFSANES